MIKVTPAILEEDFSHIEQKVVQVKPFVDMIHLDIMDGEFVPHVTFRDMQKIGTLNINIGVHLMVARPEFTIGKWAALDNVVRIIVHEKAVTNVDEVAKQVHKKNKKFGLAISPDLSLMDIKDHVGLVDVLLIMGVDPGSSGQNILPDTVEKVIESKKMFPQIPVIVDGGVNKITIKKLRAAGVDEVVSCSYLFNSPNIQEAIQSLQ